MALHVAVSGRVLTAEGEVSAKQAADLLGVSPQTVRNWKRAGLLRPIRAVSRGAGDAAVFARADVEALRRLSKADRRRRLKLLLQPGEAGESQSLLMRERDDLRDRLRACESDLVTLHSHLGQLLRQEEADRARYRHLLEQMAARWIQETASRQTQQ